MKYSEDLINSYRKRIYEFLKDYEGDPIVIEGVPSDLLKQILFDKGLSERRYFFASEIMAVIEKIDFRNVSFDNFNISGMDFSKLKNVVFNPDYIDYGFLRKMTYFNGVYFTKEIIPSDNLCGMSFKGSFNAEIKFPEPHWMNFLNDDFCDVKFKSSHAFEGNIYHCNFEGSHGAIINLNESNVHDTVLYDATLYGELNFPCQVNITPSVEEIKKVYGDVTEPTLIRKKDFR